jgi:hypothetical protein
MSNRTSNTKQFKSCKFCKDSGKNEDIYTSHNVKDKNGNICCPILMTTLCNNCGNFGHTLKFCKSVKMMNKSKTLQKPLQIRVEVKKQNVQINRFAALDIDDDDDNNVAEKEAKSVVEPEESIKKESIVATLRRRIEDWTEFCSDSDDE